MVTLADRTHTPGASLTDILKPQVKIGSPISWNLQSPTQTEIQPQSILKIKSDLLQLTTTTSIK